MSKTSTIIYREYITRVRKKSFWVLTLISPLLLALLSFAPALIMIFVQADTKQLYVYDESGYFQQELKLSKEVAEIHYLDEWETQATQKLIGESKHHYLLKIPDFKLSEVPTFEIIGQKSAGIAFEGSIKNAMENRLKNIWLAQKGIDPKIIENLKFDLNIKSSVTTDQGTLEEKSANASAALSFIGGLLTYFLVFLYAGQVASGIHEEKSNRVVEIIISSVKPFQLMMGKILGIGLVGLTQFVFWIVLTVILVTIIGLAVGIGFIFTDSAVLLENAQKSTADMGGNVAEQEMILGVLREIQTVNLAGIISVIFIYFIGGYFLYSALFAAVAAATDNETDMRQLSVPLSIPLILALVSNNVLINDPDNAFSSWLSMIPFTSPVSMPSRMAYGIANWELWLSILLLFLGFLGTTWVAGKIYRIGILMYGTKVSFKTLMKWLLQ